MKAIYHDRSFLQSTSQLPADATFGVLLDRTSFYAESGGQEYDTGNIVIDGVADFQVDDVQVYNGYVLHTGQLKYGTLNIDDEVVSSYDEVDLPVFDRNFFSRLPHSFEGGPSGIITPQLTSSIFAYVTLSEITSIKKDPSLHQRNSDSISHIKHKLHSQIYKKLRLQAEIGSNETSKFSARRSTSRLHKQFRA